jgi:hypothetical protein
MTRPINIKHRVRPLAVYIDHIAQRKPANNDNENRRHGEPRIGSQFKEV